MPPQPPHRADPEEPPPLLGSWGRIYAVVAAYLLFIILLFHIFTRVFNR